MDKHLIQKEFVYSQFKRIMLKAGRRGGKTVGMGTRAAINFVAGRRQFYAAPSSLQCDAFWKEVVDSLQEGIDAGIYKKNESTHKITDMTNGNMLEARTAWNKDMLRGAYGDDIYLDEFQLMDEKVLDDVVYPMLADNNGNLIMAFTPPSLTDTGTSHARDRRHATKLFKKHMNDDPSEGKWQCIHFTSYDNPHISQEALQLLAEDMNIDSYRRELLAEDDNIEENWLVYHAFNDITHKITPFDIPKKWPVYTGHDFGKANPAALFVAQKNDDEELIVDNLLRIQKGDFVIFAEYRPSDSPGLLKRVEDWKDMNANVVMSVGGSKDGDEEIRQGHGGFGWPIEAPRYGRLNTQVLRGQTLFENNRVWIFSTCHRLLAEIAGCMWELDDEGHITDKIQYEAKYHLLACWRYLACNLPTDAAMGVVGKGRSMRVLACD